MLSQTISRLSTVPSSLQGPSNKQVKCKHSVLEEQGEEFCCVDTGFTFFSMGMTFPDVVDVVRVVSLVLYSLRKKPVYSSSAEAILTHLVPEPWPDAVCLDCFPGVPSAATASLLLSRGEVGKLAGDREGEISSRHAVSRSWHFLYFPLSALCSGSICLNLSFLVLPDTSPVSF